MNLVFLELDTHHCHLDFKLLDENKNVITPKTFYLHLLNRVYTLMTQVKFIQIKPFSFTRATSISLENMKQFNTITGIVDVDIVTTVITGAITAPVFQLVLACLLVWH